MRGLIAGPALALMLAAAVAGCSRDSDPGPGGVTQGEAKALDDAAQMLESRPAPPLVDATVPADLLAPEASGTPE
ncbi:hypothetical protein [Novosphingobium cyanobacteriorum]|uniref:Argininosuccinate lyase n=1 Tax=Novosphingobium cyanobacteriorum TaxID=3024215 RepID=A0ABT6CGX5_9SPHN|nr:hypothetical protein [Novosphingobium cyanobacteriorum]MDF8333178.1 hypothetical protein [Novosphingobium cyanobacteriorum]